MRAGRRARVFLRRTLRFFRGNYLLPLSALALVVAFLGAVTSFDFLERGPESEPPRSLAVGLSANNSEKPYLLALYLVESEERRSEVTDSLHDGRPPAGTALPADPDESRVLVTGTLAGEARLERELLRANVLARTLDLDFTYRVIDLRPRR